MQRKNITFVRSLSSAIFSCVPKFMFGVVQDQVLRVRVRSRTSRKRWAHALSKSCSERTSLTAPWARAGIAAAIHDSMRARQQRPIHGCDCNRWWARIFKKTSIDTLEADIVLCCRGRLGQKPMPSLLAKANPERGRPRLFCGTKGAVISDNSLSSKS